MNRHAIRKHRTLCKWIYLALSICLFANAVTGCAKTEISEEAKIDMAEAFLTEFFSFNNHQRYDAFAEVITGSADTVASGLTEEGIEAVLEQQQQAYEEYYRAFADMATQNCIATMQANRLPLKYDSLIAQDGISAEINTIHCEAYDESTFTFEVSFNSDHELFQNPAKGRITIQVMDGQVYIDSITIY